METTQLHHKVTSTYTFQQVETILFMAFSQGNSAILWIQGLISMFYYMDFTL